VERRKERPLTDQTFSLLVLVGAAGGDGLADTDAMQVAGPVDPRLFAILDQAASREEIAVGEDLGTLR